MAACLAEHKVIVVSKKQWRGYIWQLKVLPDILLDNVLELKDLL